MEIEDKNFKQKKTVLFFFPLIIAVMIKFSSNV